MINVNYTSQFPRMRFMLGETPLYMLTNISSELERDIYIKRDDMTGVALGGNKVRKLEFLMADAIKNGADTVITAGGAQSNHAMLTAACARIAGLEPVLMLKKRGVTELKGNQKLNKLMGADVRFIDTDSYDDVYAAMDEYCIEAHKNGHKAYKIPVGGSVPLGTLGYLECARELYTQADKMGIKFDRVVATAGSGGTLAGLLLGTLLYSPQTHVNGVAVCPDPFENIVSELVNDTADIIGAPIHISAENVDILYWYGEGYAIPSPEGNAAIEKMARSEGVFLDPVYTGKTMAGLIELIKRDVIKKGEKVLFLHSGGAGSIFAF